ncbi:hypothetical protein EC991_008645 [Linnemannia zychae]|nr:hypothetical protein EC991_008645 [Linnemannia zychae]
MDAPAPAPNDGEYKLVFLNELHETLKRLDPRRVHSAGLFRILGRLVEYDIYDQIVKVESVFHHEYIVQPIVLSSTVAATTGRSKSRSTNETKAKKSKGQDDNVLKQPCHQSHFSSSPGSGRSQEGSGGQMLYSSASNSNSSSMTIDLTLDDRDEEAVMGEVDHYNSQGEEDDDASLSNSTSHNPDSVVSTFSSIDLTNSTDDEENEEHSNDAADSPVSLSNGSRKTTEPLTTTKLRRAPKVVLWVDTQLLSARVFEPNALFQFMGEVMYYHPITTVATTSSITTATAITKPNRSSVRGQQGGHWVLQARTARLMDGLDLYSYRMAILLTRKLIQQYQQREKERQLDKAKLKEEKEQKEQREQWGYAMAEELE